MEQVDAELSSHPGFFQRFFRVVRHNKWKSVGCVLLLFLAVEIGLLPFSDVERLKKENPKETAFMQFAAESAKERGTSFRKRQSWIPLSRIPQHTIHAVIVAEDGTFWSHGGFDWFEFWESLSRNMKELSFARGASTITQQLVKNLYLSSSKDPLRKLKEWALTWKMENTLSKWRIIELYLNVIEWGDGIYGIEAAAQYYFGKSAAELTREESARLAAVIPSPKRLEANSDSRTVASRVNLILSRMEARRWGNEHSQEDSVVLGDSSQFAYRAAADTLLEPYEPEEEEFNSHLSNELRQYFSQRYEGELAVEWEFLQEIPTVTGLAFPKYYLWVSVSDSSGHIIDGVGCVAAVEESNFNITHFIERGDITSKKVDINTIFPPSVCEMIMVRAH